MDLLIKAIAIVALLYIMYRAAEYMVESSTAIAKYFKVSDLVIGLTVVAIGTSAPEMVVSISATLQGSGDIAVSNIVGSNIYNLGIILGVVALVAKSTISEKILYRDVLTLVGISILQYIFFLDGELSRIEGFIVLLVFSVWFYFVFTSTSKNEIDVEEIDAVSTKKIWKHWGIFIISLASLVASGHFMVDLASDIARSLGVSEWIIGLTIVGIGTSTPELITSLVAIMKRSVGISLGNLFGSDIFNQGLVLAIASMLVPISTKGDDAASGFLFISLYVAFLFVLFWWRKRLSYVEGIIIITIVSTRFAWEVWKGIA